jgi:hypothetical protein
MLSQYRSVLVCNIIYKKAWPILVMGSWLMQTLYAPCSWSTDITISHHLDVYRHLPCYILWEQAAWQFKIPVLYRSTQISQLSRPHMYDAQGRTIELLYTTHIWIHNQHIIMSHITQKITSDTTVQFYQVKYDLLYNGLLCKSGTFNCIGQLFD